MTRIKVMLWGTQIGAAVYNPSDKVAVFEYTPDFIESGIQPSPITMPVLEGYKYSFPNLSYETFSGLPGLLSDSLPDTFGNTMTQALLGRPIDSLDCLERLLYVGNRGMGALEFKPAKERPRHFSNTIEPAALVQLANEVLQKKSHFSTTIQKGKEHNAIKELIQLTSSAGGSRAKAVIAWNPQTQEIRSGQVCLPQGFEHWLIKLDGVGANQELELSQGYGVAEYAYYKMAIQCGITMAPCAVIKENGRTHFLTKRFDRLSNGSKVHMQTLGALTHSDFNQPGTYSYEQAFDVMDQLKLSQAEKEQQFLRMVFNVIARNQDDHVKNISFLMDKEGTWTLSPAYDLTYNFNPKGLTASHQMLINGKRDNITSQDLLQCAKTAKISIRVAKGLVQQVLDIVSQWECIAQEAEVPRERIQKIQRNFWSIC